MKLWLDAQLPPLLAHWINAQGMNLDAVAVREIGLRDANDAEIFRQARTADAVVMTKDRDFIRLLEEQGPPPQVIWLRVGNTSNASIRSREAGRGVGSASQRASSAKSSAGDMQLPPLPQHPRHPMPAGSPQPFGVGLSHQQIQIRIGPGVAPRSGAKQQLPSRRRIGGGDPITGLGHSPAASPRAAGLCPALSLEQKRALAPWRNHAVPP